ncbi:pyrroline-5-carboxylate reductase [Thermoproteota archaeon]
MTNVGKVGIIGLGKMGEALVSGLLLSKFYLPKDISAYEIITERSQFISSKYGIKMLKTISDVAVKSEIIILVVKPKEIFNVLQEIKKIYLKNKIIISVAAGIKTSYIMKHLPEETEVIRAMPNLACSLGEGMICVSRSQRTSQKSFDKSTELFKLTGKVFQINEKDIEVVTGISGSGPAYVYAFIEALTNAGVKLGLKSDIALTLATQTTLGASKLVFSSGENPEKLKNMVATPGGTTIEGINALEKGGLKELILEAVTKATEKSCHLQNSLDE